MITSEVIAKVRNGVCAVGYLTVPLEEYRKNHEGPYFQVIGTGFLIRDTTIMTNRHVVEGLFEYQKKYSFPTEQFFIQFVVPGEGQKPRITVRMMRYFWTHKDENIDVGFLEFKIVNEQHFKDIEPLVVVAEKNLQVSEEIAVCGYPYGTSMLIRERETKVYRWGPVLQQGHISAISPFDTAEEPDEILLDARTAEGMSGAPIFRPSNGEIIGIHHSGMGTEGIICMGLPFTKQKVDTWLQIYDEALKTEADKKSTE